MLQLGGGGGSGVLKLWSAIIADWGGGVQVLKLWSLWLDILALQIGGGESRCTQAVVRQYHNEYKLFLYCAIKGAIQVLRNAIFLEIGPPPPRNANSIEHYTFITLFSRKSDTPTPICVT